MMVSWIFDVRILEMTVSDDSLGYGHGNSWLRWTEMITELMPGSDIRH